MSSSKNGPRAVNSVGKHQFGKWFLYQTSEKMDTWKKPVVDDTQGIIVPDSYIRIIRRNPTPSIDTAKYNFFFVGEAGFLRDYFKVFEPRYENHITPFEFDDIQAAKDYIDRFIERLNNLLAFT